MRNDRIYDDQPSNPLIFVVEDDKDGRTSPANTDLVSIIEKRGQTNDRWRLCPTGGHGDSFQRASRERVRNSSEPVRDFRSRRTQSRGLITFAILLESPNYYNNNGLELSDNNPSVKSICARKVRSTILHRSVPSRIAVDHGKAATGIASRIDGLPSQSAKQD
jgi:hypothetical protein